MHPLLRDIRASCPEEKRSHWAFFLRAKGRRWRGGDRSWPAPRAIGLRKYFGFAAMTVSVRLLGMGGRAMRRLMDVSIAGAALLVLGSLLLIGALPLRMQDGGLVFFRQRRIGRGNRFFYILNFRSMKVEEMRPSRGAVRQSRRSPRDPCRPVHPPHQHRRTSPASEYPARRHVAGRPALACVGVAGR